MRNSKVIPFGPFIYSLRGPFCICTILMVLIVATSLVVFNRSATSNPTFADNVSSLFAGMPQISQSISSNAAMPKIKIPFAWLILVLLPHLMCFLAVSRSLRKDMYLVMSSSKSFYPILLTVSCVTATGLYWIIVGVVILLFTLLHGGEILSTTTLSLEILEGFDASTLPANTVSIVPLMGSLFISSLSLITLQCSAGLFIKEWPPLFLIISWIVSSIFKLHPILIGNYMMFSRSSLYIDSTSREIVEGNLCAGVNPLFTLAFCIGSLGIFLYLSLSRFKNIDQFGGE